MNDPNPDLDLRECLAGYQDSERQYVQALKQRIAELEMENTWLRQAAGAFGELAERLNEVVQQRQAAQFPSYALRPTPDRRKVPRSA